jgi:hypothetical protein
MLWIVSSVVLLAPLIVWCFWWAMRSIEVVIRGRFHQMDFYSARSTRVIFNVHHTQNPEILIAIDFGLVSMSPTSTVFRSRLPNGSQGSFSARRVLPAICAKEPVNTPLTMSTQPALHLLNTLCFLQDSRVNASFTFAIIFFSTSDRNS